ncbi:DnaQ DNA polymerase III, epsilon subunit and related 3'-5' exonucleases [uncultured Caudovirales phage]|uniref:DnaQ DNA polymerase III, epsilon subunit and related 3'-5' exonucleases n=1 Tax=uncultured Caudovirales phage TaxID=2100421 RepID=A0A6J5R517_9CAUD|nr:DnaQ DNA polymerase III, epsilon subunit and related 3'-5' exonucleases [uncultured Caudovirales phage]
MLTLERPLIALDVETHMKGGPDVGRICEIGFIQMFPDGREPKRWRSFINPGVPIDVGATAVHGIVDADVADAPTFKMLADNLHKGFTGVDFAGYNVKFDLRVIQAEFARCGIQWDFSEVHLMDSLRMWQVANPRSLSDATIAWLGREPGKAHRALEDAEDAHAVGLAILKTEAFSSASTVRDIHEICFPPNPDHLDPDGKIIWIDGVACLSFGKHANIQLVNVPKGYLSWMSTGDFSAPVKNIVLEALMGRFPTK